MIIQINSIIDYDDHKLTEVNFLLNAKTLGNEQDTFYEYLKWWFSDSTHSIMLKTNSGCISELLNLRRSWKYLVNYLLVQIYVR